MVKVLDDELAVNQDYINGRIKYLNLVEKRGIQLIKLTGPSPSNVSIDSLSGLLLNVIYQGPYAPIVANYKSIMGSDDKNLIRHEKLMELLVEYDAKLELTHYPQFEMRDNIIQYLQTNYSSLHMLNVQSNRFFQNLKKEDYTSNYFPIDSKTILSDRNFQSMIVTRFEANGYTIHLLKQLLEHIEEMREYILNNYT